MRVTEYKQGDYSRYFEDLKYWSNACGELHHHGEYDIDESQLPEELKRAYNELWSESTGSYCYLAEYQGEYKIALISEFSENDKDIVCPNMDSLYRHMQTRANAYITMDEFKDAEILLAEELGFLECHEIVVLLPCDMDKEAFDRVADILHQTMYTYGDVKEILKEEEKKKAALPEDELRVTGLFYMKTLPGETKEEAQKRFLKTVYDAGLDVCNASLSYELESETDKTVEYEER